MEMTDECGLKCPYDEKLKSKIPYDYYKMERLVLLILPKFNDASLMKVHNFIHKIKK